MDAKDVQITAHIDQATTTLKHQVAPLLWAFYSGLITEGFDKEQAMSLTYEYLDRLMPSVWRGQHDDGA